MVADSENAKCSLNYKPFLGLFYTGMSAVFITLTSVFVKQLKYISPAELSMIRCSAVWIGSLPIAIYCVREVLGPKKYRPLLFVRGLLAATAIYLSLIAFRYIPIAEAAIIMATMPAVVSVIARIYLKEPCGLVQGFALLTTFGGVLLSVRLPEVWSGSRHSKTDDSNYILGVASAFGSVVIFSGSFIALRKMKDIHFSVSLLYTRFIGMVENGAISAASSHFTAPRCGWDQLSVMLIGIFGFGVYCTMTLAVQVEAVGIVSVMKAAMDIIVAIVFQAIFFNTSPDMYGIGGAFLVIVSVSVIGLKKWVVTLPKESETRKILKFVLL